MAVPSPPPRRRRLFSGLAALLLLAALVFGYGEYRAWQLRTSCTDAGGEWDRARTQCTFRGAVPAPPPPATP